MIEPTVTLSGGAVMPRLALGVFQAPRGDITKHAVQAALQAGYRHVDTAAIYRNEADVGAALRESGLDRDEVFVTTKLWNEEQGYDRALRAFDASMMRLDLEVLDLYLLHWPVTGLRVDSWRALVRLRDEGRVRAIGVSNFTPTHIDGLIQATGVVPEVNQVEAHPFLAQPELRRYCAEHGVVVQAYSPLTRGQKLGDPTIRRVADALGRTPAQVMLRWALERDMVILPKSTTPARIEENAAVFDFELGAEHLAALDALDADLHIAWNPSGVP